eukprot:14088742-Ditylum_brightwellii.AAC.1
MKIHKFIWDTRYVDKVKIYAKKNQESSTIIKGELAYINSACDTVDIGGCDNHHTIQERIKIGNSITATTLQDGDTALFRVYEATFTLR